MRTVPGKGLTPQKVAGLTAAVVLQVGFIWALVSGLAATLIEKLPEELKVAVEQEKIQPKPPPPPPPQVDIPPPPSVPPPAINIQVETTASPITVTNKPPPPAPPPVVHAAVSTPVSVGRPHECASRFYPEASMRLNEEGTTLISFKVMTDGAVTDVTVSKSSGFPRLDEAAISCAGKWRYKPATQEGNPVEASWQANVVWKVPR